MLSRIFCPLLGADIEAKFVAVERVNTREMVGSDIFFKAIHSSKRFDSIVSDTVVRKQASLASNTRSTFLTALCQALNELCIVLSDSNEQIQPSSPVLVTRNDNPIAPSLF
mmetsp:Transcript_49612/g.49988  ORF Transcript_49612/g.49988 Transcript_49612/m.49988 type:complete len:111 (-) Transcript_49612:810-1142(-)